ncbi:sce7726 family protein [Sphingopyxis sp. FD7]|uniref:sce7726 family protein n=1 Tax=Sphingopyxis sp. FD7 TaxID=1914525 RepID=UPI000DC63EFF|nr:sce7726 family protein [Sphingopyxis sp. FD7]BBB12513.1 hypothetical protein SPYCA_1771 [Sphingopyxis sp. FD7]
MDEAAVKAQVLDHIRQASGRRKPILTAELTLGTSGTRADVAVLSDEELIGLEIKTERDSLRRLPSQIEAYARYFDHVVIVAAPCHFADLAEMDLHGASVWRSTKDGLDPLISGQRNSVSPLAYLDLMTRQEKKEVVAKGDATVREHYFDTFTRRYGQTSLALWRSVARRKIKPDDVRLLSRFNERRAAVQAVVQEREERWQRWQNAYAGMEAMACTA